MHGQEGEHQEHVRDRPRRPRQVNPHRLPRLQGKRNICLAVHVVYCLFKGTWSDHLGSFILETVVIDKNLSRTC